MKSHAIQISLNLGERQHLWTAVQNSFADLLREEPGARHAAMLMLLRMSQEAEPPAPPVVSPQASLPLGNLGPTARGFLEAPRTATEPLAGPVALHKPVGCGAKIVGGCIVCDTCLRFFEFQVGHDFVCVGAKEV
jgi:hypothetical protein